MTDRKDLKMEKVAIVYWSGTGNTEAMANLISEGSKSVGIEVSLYQASDFTEEIAKTYNRIAFGCPSMGVEVLEEVEFQPMFDAVKNHLKDKNIALFGSYGWGDGEWMRTWLDECSRLNCHIIGEQVIISGEPDAKCASDCKTLGIQLANA